MAAIEYLTVDRIPTKDLIRIFSRISIDPAINWNGTPCWMWIGLTSRGYAYRWWPPSKSAERVHRLLYAWLISPLPRRVKGHKTPNLDHLCKRTSCVNPLHLELVAPQINTLRYFADKTRCPHGHRLDRVHTTNGYRYCGTCSNLHKRQVYAANPEIARQRLRSYRLKKKQEQRSPG